MKFKYVIKYSLSVPKSSIVPLQQQLNFQCQIAVQVRYHSQNGTDPIEIKLADVTYILDHSCKSTTCEMETGMKQKQY